MAFPPPRWITLASKPLRNPPDWAGDCRVHYSTSRHHQIKGHTHRECGLCFANNCREHFGKLGINQLRLILRLSRKSLARISYFRDVTSTRRAVAWVCVLLVLVFGVISVTHVHLNELKAANHSCSLCAVAHAGAIGSGIYYSAPVLASLAVLVTAENSPCVLRLVSSLYIRPPPSV